MCNRCLLIYSKNIFPPLDGRVIVECLRCLMNDVDGRCHFNKHLPGKLPSLLRFLLHCFEEEQLGKG